MKANWILTGIAIAVGVGLLVAVAMLWAYGHYLGPISSLATDWGSFGSVMSGAFTLLSSFATIGTLLFLYLQQIKSEQRQAIQDTENQIKQQKHDDVVERQLAALTFEQYLSHRKLFIDRLHDQSQFYKGEIDFIDPDRVYSAIFSKNNPNHCEYKVKIDTPDIAKPQDLTDCIAIYKSIGELLENYREKEKHLILIQKIFHLQGCLGMQYVGDAKEGDIIFLKINTGINIYNISRTLQRLERTLNSILFYTGNENITPLSHKGNSSHLRDSIYDTLKNYHRARGAVEIFHELQAMPYLHKIYEESQIHFIVSERILEKTYATLASLFSSHEEIIKLNDFDFADKLTDIIHFEIQSAKEKYKNDSDALEILERINRHHRSAMDHLGIGV